MGLGAACALLLMWTLGAEAQSSCTPETKTACGSQYCDFPVENRPSCVFTWPGTAAAMSFMCVTSSLSGTCRACPLGWTASGAFCVECDPLKSCDRQGQPQCDGACLAAKYPTCDAVTKRVTCLGCSVNYTALAANKRRLTRGGVLDSPDLCEAYFQCEKGFFLTASAASGALLCQACEFPEPSQSGWSTLSRGLTFGDRYSCLYNATEAVTNNNALGQFGSSLRSCPAGRTSRPNRALTEAQCVPCPNPPAYGSFAQDVPECVPECSEGYALRGDACVPVDAALVDCDADGYVFRGGVCQPAPLPWSAQAKEQVEGKLMVTQARADAWDALDADGDFRVLRATGKLGRQGVTDFCSGIASTIPTLGYVQDKPLFTKICADVEKHAMYLVATGQKYVYVFLERAFGNNNRFVMWQVQKASSASGNAGQVWQTFRLPAKVCSAVVVPGDVVYLALCGSPAVTFAKQVDYTVVSSDPDNPSITLSGTQYVIGRRLGVLIGKDEVGRRDGMLDQALFGSSLSVATTSDPKRLLVADYGNCRIVEVVVDFPGSFLTRATTVGAAACFDGDFPLPYPRSIVSVLGGVAALFLTDRGVVQLDARMRRFTLILTAEEVKSSVLEPRWLVVDQSGERLTLHNATHYAAVTRLQVACPARSRSRRGGACSACPTGTYSTGGACSACTSPTCAAGFGWVNCSDSADAYCRACTETRPYAFRYGPQCEVIPQYPCPSGYYGLSDCYACDATPVTQLGEGLCQCLGFSLRADRSCWIESPLPSEPSWLARLACTYEDSNCTDLGCYLARVQPRWCQPCGAGTYALDGLRCTSCPGFRKPSPARDACVCRAPSVVSADGSACVCPAGHAAGGSAGCAPCAAGTVKEAATVLPNAYAALSGGACSYCMPGFEPSQDKVSCVACSFGKYREGAMTECQACSAALSYAADATSGASCVACSSSCAAGQRWGACPVGSSYFTCTACPAMSRFRQLVPGGRSCEWQCVSNFYERFVLQQGGAGFASDCFPCTKPKCANGFNLTQCSKYEDAHCRVPCVNASKPEEHSVWGASCTWDCEAGYVRVLKQYPGWTEYACEVKEEFPWSLGF